MSIPSKKSNSTLKSIISYTVPKLYIGKEWYVGFYAFNPASNKMQRKKIKINFIERIGDRRRYAAGLIKRLVFQLEKGWNPWVETENGKAYHTFCDVCDHYIRYIGKLHNDGVYREDTYKAYVSYMKNIRDFNDQFSGKITYIYQFDRNFIDDFLEYIYIDKNNSPQTRNNYLTFARIFSSFLVQHRYLKTKPTEGMSMISKRLIKKERTIILSKDMMRLKSHLEHTNKHYLLACYILHYCFIRPKEMSFLKIEDISLKNQSIFLRGEFSKNRVSGLITIPAKVIHFMNELKIFDYPGSFFLFSDRFRPGETKKTEKQFRDYWSSHIRKELNFPTNYKFYSLKDTGITSMLRTMDKISVRDQARHSSVLITDIYTPHDLQEANHLIKNHEGNF